MYFYDKNTNGFYIPTIHTDLFNEDGIPIGILEGAVEVTEEQHKGLFRLQEIGYSIQPDLDGFPSAIKFEPSLNEVVKAFEIALQLHLDNKAKEYGYDNIYTAVSYADEPSIPEFQLEGKAFRSWRSLYWFTVNQIKAEISSGTRQIPTIEALIEELPKLDLPPTELT